MVQYLGDSNTTQPELLADVVRVRVLDTSLQYLVPHNYGRWEQRIANVIGCIYSRNFLVIAHRLFRLWGPWTGACRSRNEQPPSLLYCHLATGFPLSDLSTSRTRNREWACVLARQLAATYYSSGSRAQLANSLLLQ